MPRRASFKDGSAKGIALGLLTLIGGCSLFIDQSADQCSKDGDCARFGAVCVSGVCVARDAGAPNDFAMADLTTSSPDLATPLGPPGCFAGVPSSPLEFANACTSASCMPFDNCARLGLCGAPDGGLPLIPPGDLGTVTVTGAMEPTPAINCSAAVNPVYMTGSTNLAPLALAMGPLLAQNNPPYSLVWQASSSCNGVETIFNADPTKRVMKDVPPSGSTPANWAAIINADGSKTYCYLAVGGTPVDVGESDVYSTSCNSVYTPSSGVGEYQGPILAITLVVPSLASQKVISAEAAHVLFGEGNPNATLNPWTDPSLYFVRSSSTGTNQLVSRAIDVPPSKWWGIDRKSASNLAATLEVVSPQLAEQAIGILGADTADRERNNLRILYFQATGQICGFLPDATPFTKDKLNVRDGHYPIWGPTHFYTAITGGVPSPQASALLNYITAPRTDPAFLNAAIDAGFIPSCAMKVTRSTEMGPLSAYQPPFGCSCYFENRINGSTTCTACQGPLDCPKARPACNNKFCEVQ